MMRAIRQTGKAQGACTLVREASQLFVYGELTGRVIIVIIVFTT